MTDKAISPLRRRLIEDMTIRRLSPKTHYQLEGLKGYIAPHRASAWCVGRLAQILRKRPIHQHSLHILETG